MDIEASTQVSSFLREFIEFSSTVSKPIDIQIVYLVIFKKYRDFTCFPDGVLKVFKDRSEALKFHRDLVKNILSKNILSKNCNTKFLMWSEEIEEKWNNAPIESFPPKGSRQGTYNDPLAKLDIISKDPMYSSVAFSGNMSFTWAGVFQLVVEEKKLY